MKTESKEKNIKYPENLRYKQLLKRKDSAKIAELTGLHRVHIRLVLNGDRLMSDEILTAIYKIINARERIEKRLSEYTKTA